MSTNATGKNGGSGKANGSTGQLSIDDPAAVRLRAARLDAQRRIAEPRARLGEKHPIVIAAQACLDNADRYETERNYFVAWDCIHQFDHEMLAAIGDLDRHMHWLSLAAEAGEKLKGWRIKASEALIKNVGDRTPAPLAAVKELHTHLWATAQNQHHKIHVYENQTLPSVRALLVAVVVTALLFFWYTVFVAESPSKAMILWAENMLLGVTAGALGGILSMTFALGRVDTSKKIPDARLGALMTSIRPLLGAAVAIPVVALVQAKFVEIKPFEGSLAILAFCFVAGFSERWFVGLIERLGDKK